MKKTTFNCDPLKPGAMLALQTHRDTYPNGMSTYKGKSNHALYVNLGYVAYETKYFVVIGEMK
tara:strand:- start:90 stop:278 length:189 start_codon:yes stop_codon:yes gene_type:complete